MAQATWFSTSREMSYYNSGAAKSYGDVVVIGPIVASVKDAGGIAAGAYGPVRINDIMTFVKDSSAWSAGADIYWNATGNPVGGTVGTGAATTTSSGNTLIGPAELAALTGDTTARVINFSATGSTAASGAVTASSITGTASTLPIAGAAAATVTSAGGAVSITGAAGGATSGTGGGITFTGGAGTAGNSAGGAVAEVGGAGQGSAAGGAVTHTGGAGGATGTGGAVSLVSGNGGASSGAAGAIAITVGSATSANGSAITLTAGNGAGGTNSGGNINCIPGTAVSTGTPGEFMVNSDAGLICISEALTATDATRTVFVATRACRFKGVKEIHTTASSSGTLQIEKCTGTTAPGSGTVLLTGTMSLAGTANTVVSGTLVSTVASLTLAAGDRLSVVIGGTMTNLAGSVVTLMVSAC